MVKSYNSKLYFEVKPWVENDIHLTDETMANMSPGKAIPRVEQYRQLSVRSKDSLLQDVTLMEKLK